MARSVFLSILQTIAVLSAIAAASGAETIDLIKNGEALRLNDHELLGEEQKADGLFALRSAKPGTSDEFGSHYISIGALGDVILAPGDFKVGFTMGLV